MTKEGNGKVKIVLKGASASAEAVRLSKKMESFRKSLINSPAMRAIEEQSKRWKELMSSSGVAAMTGSLEMLKVGRIAEEAMANAHQLSSTASSIALNFQAMDLAAKRYAELYRSPFQGEFDKIAATARQVFEARNAATTLYQAQFDEVRRMAESIHSPWLNSQNALASFQGIQCLSSIGKALREARHPFEKSATHLLRDQLGDWRHVHVSKRLALEPFQRSEFYFNQGLNPLLTDYPSTAFDEALDVTKIRPAEIKPGISSYQRPSEFEPDIDEPPIHMVEAYKIIYLFESRIRRFIDEIMTKRYGSNWAKHRVPGDMKNDWEEKRIKALDSGEPERPLICYADFTHYETVIVRKDNWEEVFKAVFRNKESVTESLRRLYPMRIPTMHTRIIISDDMLYLFAETQRILKAIDEYLSYDA